MCRSCSACTRKKWSNWLLALVQRNEKNSARTTCSMRVAMTPITCVWPRHLNIHSLSFILLNKLNPVIQFVFVFHSKSSKASCLLSLFSFFLVCSVFCVSLVIVKNDVRCVPKDSHVRTGDKHGWTKTRTHTYASAGQSTREREEKELIKCARFG